jgi:hypothetical protein
MVHQVSAKWVGEVTFDREYNGLIDSNNTEHLNEGVRCVLRARCLSA